MSLTKDGFYKQIGGVTGDNSYVLLAGGGHQKFGNESSYIPISNGTKNVNLNADLLDGYHSSSFSFTSHTHSVSINGSTKTIAASGGTSVNLGTYHPWFKDSSLNANSADVGWHDVANSITNAAHSNHSSLIYVNNVGTPYQLQIPDSSVLYIYKRWYSGGSWSAWNKIRAGYADSAGSVAWGNVTGKPDTFTPSSHNHDDRYYTESESDNRFLNVSGDTMNSGGQIVVGSISNSSGAVYNGGIQLRERTYSTTNLSGTVYTDGPAITFHWGGKWVHILNMHSDDLFWDNNKIWHEGNDGSGTGLDADKVDGYHASSLWRSDGGVWNPSANITLGATANSQEWSFDITRNGYTGCYWHVWDSAYGTLLKVNADDGKVSAPYGFVGNISGTASNADTVDGYHANRFAFTYNSANYGGSSGVTVNDLVTNGVSNASHGMIYSGTDNPYSSSGNWVHVWSQQWTIGTTSSWVSQIALGVQQGTGMWYRTTSGNIVGRGWTRVLDSSNWTSYGDGRYLRLSGGWMDTDAQIYFKGANSSTSVYGSIGYRDSFNEKMHLGSDTYNTKALYICSNGYNAANDCGGIAIDNDGVTAFGAGDTGSVFRVLNEDNVGDGAQFAVTKASGVSVKRWLHINTQNSGTDNGITFYGSDANYSIMCRNTSQLGTFGDVSADWAMYFNMNNNNTRGWIFRRWGSANVFSISARGYAYGARLWLSHYSNVSPGYSWTNSALTTPSIEIQNYTGTTESMYPTLTLHHYGYGGPRLGSRQGVLTIYGGNTDAKTLGSRNSYFKSMKIYPEEFDGLYVNDIKVLLGYRRLNLNISSTDSGMIPPDILGFKNGYPLYTDPEFASGNNSIGVYNNSGGSAVTIVRESSTTSGNSSGYCLHIHSAASGASPYGGGFYFGSSGARGKVYVCIFRAYIPSGYNVVFHTNSIGTGGNSGWLTSQNGTGKYEWYAYMVEFGTASLSSTFFFTLNAAANVDWYLSYANVIDVTRGNYDGLRTRYSDYADSLTNPGKYYWANIQVQTSSSTSTYPQFGSLNVINDSQNNGTDGLVYFRHYSNNDWGLIVDKSQSYSYGVDIRAGGAYALKVGNGNTRLVGATTIGADAAPSYTLDTRGTIRATGRIYANEWIEFSQAYTGLYWPNGNNASHFHPNDATTYGNFVLRGSRGGYSGITMGRSANYMTIMDNGTDKGLYNETNGRWIIYYNRSNNRVSLYDSSVDLGYGVQINNRTGIKINSYPSLHLYRTDTGETSQYFSNNTAGWAIGINPWGVGAGVFAIGQYSGTGSSTWRFKIDNNGYCYTNSYLNLGAGNEKNASNPPYVLGFNGSDTYIRSYQTGYLNVNYANYSGWSNWSHYLAPHYDGGDRSNPQQYFNYSIGVKVAMTRNTSLGGTSMWADTLWINGYTGGDVPNMCALTFARNASPRFFISTQSNRATSYGTYYEVASAYNTYVTNGYGYILGNYITKLYPVASNPDNSHPGYGCRVFYSWNTGQAGNGSSGYSNGITIGSHPNDQAYGFQIVQNMWDDRLYFRRYNGGWQSWRTCYDDAYHPYADYSSTVAVNNSDANSTYRMVWHSGNTLYSTGGIYCNPSSDYLYASSFYCGNWFRSSGQSGWYNESYGGGIWMTDSSWVRTYGSKHFYVEGGNFAVSGSAGIGTTSPGYKLDVQGNGRFTGRLYPQEWVEFTGYQGLYWPGANEAAHIYPNSTTSYGAFIIRGARNGYAGIQLGRNGTNTGYMTIMDNQDDKGLYEEDWGWILYFNRRNKKLSFRTSSDLGADNNFNGSLTAWNYRIYGSAQAFNCNDVTCTGLWYYSSKGPSTQLGARSTDGALYSQAYSTSWVGQIAQDYRDGGLYVRGKNNNSWQKWLQVMLVDLTSSAVTNCNSVYRTGIYTHSGFSNRPSGVDNWGTLLNYKLYEDNNSYHRQIFLDCYGTNRIWTRANNGGTWTDWVELVRNTGTWAISITGNADTVDNQHFTYSNSSNSPTYLWGTNSSGTNFLARRDSLSVSYANSAGNADTVDGYHASNLVRFFLSPMTSGAPADSAKSWFTGTMPSASGAIIYNVPGSEKTIIAGKSSGSYGHMLQLNYDDTYLRILRYQGGSWKSTDWEKISAGYADSSGNADKLDGYHEYNFMHVYGFVSGQNFNIADSARTSGIYYRNKDSGSNANAPTDYGLLVDFNSNAGHLQLYSTTTKNDLKLRTYWWTNGSGFTYPSWVTVLTSANWSSYISTSPTISKTTTLSGTTYVAGTSSNQTNFTTCYYVTQFYFTSSGAFHTSDVRKKYDIRDILNDDVNRLFETENGFIRHYKWKETDKDAYGFIAQELEEYCPEAIDFNNDTGYYAVNYNVAFSKIIGAMFKKIKELERKLKENGIP